MKAQENIFFQEFNTPRETFPFDKIKTDDYLPAMREGIRKHEAEIKAITENKAKPTFENTIVALERSGAALSRVQQVFYNLLNAETSDAMDAIANEIAPEESEHANNIFLNEKLFKRVETVYKQKDKLTLTPEEQTLLRKTYEAFVSRGAGLSAADKEKYRELSKNLSLAELQFGQNVLKATNHYHLTISDEAQLAGLPQNIKEAAALKAKEKNTEGWVFDLSAPSYIPFMKYAENRDLRRTLYLAYNTKATAGEWDNRPVLVNIANTRMHIANLMTYEDYAAYVLRKRMAENKENVYDLLYKLLDAYKPIAVEEIAEVQDYANRKGADFQIMPWDWSFYSEKLRDEKYSINDELIRPYFALENVKKGVLGLAAQLYGLQFKRNTNIPLYHPDVEAYEVFDKNGEYLSVFYMDFFPREGKRNGAWMTEFKGQWIDDKGINHRPHISIVMNFTRPTETLPSLLTFDEVTTFLHEFGHALHGMLANGHYESLTGTNVYRDFVELPSQMMENFALEQEYLDQFAANYQTGEKIPADLIRKIKTAANFNVGYQTLRQLSFGLLDMGWHTLNKEFTGDVKAFEQQAWGKAQTLPVVEEALMSTQFSHIFSGGYAAGYYSYKWAEVLDADAYSMFSKNGIFDPATANSFRTEILSKGGSEHPMILYKRFRGQEPTIEPLLRRTGVVK
ncbi:MAG: M3 family metallopeptidase [Bacteroidales bacterium]|jgi:peptidyl-dipeptidase Dcp|nr:M3 family metallopeptidase [Bacteroidales bacterium]